jgi:hypothetical protein
MALPLLFTEMLKVNEDPAHTLFDNVTGDGGLVDDHPELHHIPDVSVARHHAGCRTVEC